MRVFIQSIVAQIVLNPYIFWRGYQAIPPKKSWRIPYILFFILELSLFFFGFTFRNVLPDSVMIAIQYICNTWYIASLYITLWKRSGSATVSSIGFPAGSRTTGNKRN